MKAARWFRSSRAAFSRATASASSDTSVPSPRAFGRSARIDSRMAPEVLRLLKPGGQFAVEIGHDQAPAVRGLFEDAGAQQVQVIRDLADRDRVVAGLKNPLGKSLASG